MTPPPDETPNAYAEEECDCGSPFDEATKLTGEVSLEHERSLGQSAPRWTSPCAIRPGGATELRR
jgi:hypothetical protein